MQKNRSYRCYHPLLHCSVFRTTAARNRRRPIPQNFELVIYTVDSTNHLQRYLSTLPLTGNLDGLIILSLPVGDTEARRLIDHGLPTVLIEYPHPRLNCVEIDDVQGGYMAATYLLKKGHRRIAFLGDTDLPEYSIHPVSLRLSGFRQALKEAGIDLPDTFVRLAPYSQEQTRQVARELLNLLRATDCHFRGNGFPGTGGAQGCPPVEYQGTGDNWLSSVSMISIWPNMQT